MNEEGLPIVDINEPLAGPEPATADQFSHFDDPDLLPLWALSPAEKARRKAERERILDALEEEETMEQTREAEAARARWDEEMERRKEAQKTEMENLKRARELQKKMGRALLRSVVDHRENEEKQKAEIEKADREAAAKKTGLKPKKSVTFADECIVDSSPVPDKGKGVDWGDVSPARLRAKGQPSLLTKDHMEHLPMKMHVVERHPRVHSPAPPPAEGDSDDESDSGSLVDADSEDGGDDADAESGAAAVAAATALESLLCSTSITSSSLGTCSCGQSTGVAPAHFSTRAFASSRVRLQSTAPGGASTSKCV